MEIFNFPFHKTRTRYPEAGAKVQLGRGWIFAATPEAPVSREFTLTFKGMTYYVNTDGSIDDQTWPALNMRRLEAFYERHQTYKSFWYEHPVHGFLKCRFLNPLDIPDVVEGGTGVVEELQLQFKEVPGLVGLEYPESIPPSAPTATYITRYATTSADYSYLSISPPANQYEPDEGQTATFVFTVTRTRNLSTSCSATWTLTGTIDAADMPDDFPTSGTVSFGSGETSKTIEILIDGDNVRETSESIRVSLSDPVNCYLDIYSAQCYVLNDDSLAGGGPENGIITENGDYIVTDTGDYLVWS